MNAPTDLPSVLPCKRCNGARVNHSTGFTALDGTVYEPRTTKCYACNGRGTFTMPDALAITEAIKGRRGLVSKRPACDRAYYVWRMARFHGGADVTMPMTASMGVAHDPYRDVLDRLADLAARRYFGTDLAAAHRWGRVLGMIPDSVPETPGLPASAYSGGRVADADKPEEEANELT